MMRFDAYLNNEMSKEERVLFEQEIESNSELGNEFESHKKFLLDFNEGVDYRETKKNLKSIHKSIYNPDENFFFSRKFYIPLAAAASFVFILLIFNPAIKDGAMASNESKEDEDVAYAESADSVVMYQETSAPNVTEMLDTILEDQYVDTGSELVGYIDDAPSGTAFMISKDGYFLTAKQLVDGKKVMRLQQKEENLIFDVKVVYVDPVRDFAILKCQENIAKNFKGVPFRFIANQPHIEQDVFTLGYPTKQIIYTETVICSESGYFSDSLIFEKSFLSPGYKGAPLFSYNGDLIGLISSNKIGDKSVTYLVNHHYILDVMETLRVNDSLYIDMSQNYKIRPLNHRDFVKSYAPYIFELHP